MHITSLLTLLSLPLSALASPTLNLRSILSDPSIPRREHYFAAATPFSTLHTRSTSPNLTLLNSCELIFAEASDRSSSGLAAHLHLSSTRPFLLLEDVESGLAGASCAEEELVLDFIERTRVEEGVLESLVGGLVITSHEGCNERGERGAYRVNDIEHTDLSRSILSISPVDWHTFDTVSVSLKPAQDPLSLRPHTDLRRRQDPISSTPASQTVIGTLTLPFPTATATSSSTTFDLDTSLIDATYGPFPIAGQQVPLTVGCKNCTIAGSFDVSWLNFDFGCNVSAIMDDGFQARDCLRGGTIDVETEGMSAHVELTTELAGEFEQEFELVTIPILTVFHVPGVGTAGLSYQPTIVLGYELNGTVGMTYGFELSVPASTLHVDLVDLPSSNSSGFDDTSASLLSFTASAEFSSLSLRAALNHPFVVGFEFDATPGTTPENDTTAIAITTSVNLDIAALNTTITPLSDVDFNCAPLANSTSISTQEDRDLLAQILTSAYQIVPAIEVSLGFDAEIEVPLPGIPNPSWEYEVAKPRLELASLCANKGESGELQNATELWDKAKNPPMDVGTANEGDDGEGGAAGRVAVGTQSLFAVALAAVFMVVWI